MSPEEREEFKIVFREVTRRLDAVFRELTPEDIANINDSVEMIQILSKEGFENLLPATQERIKRVLQFLYCASILQKLCHLSNNRLQIDIIDSHMRFTIRKIAPGEIVEPLAYIVTPMNDDLRKILLGADAEFLENALKKFSPEE